MRCVRLTVLVIDPAVNDVAFVPEILVDVLWRQTRTIDLKLKNGRGIDISTVPFAGPAGSGSLGLLAHAEMELHILEDLGLLCAKKVGYHAVVGSLEDWRIWS